MIYLITLLFIAILPVAVICRYAYNKDKNKEPLSMLIKLLIYGVVSCFLVLIISAILGEIFPLFNRELRFMSLAEKVLYAFIYVALVEEFCKWIFVYTKGYKSEHFDQLYDIIVYSIFVSLGFAVFENILYVVLQGNITVGIIRAISAVPGHACDAIFMGYYLSLAKLYSRQNNKTLENRNIAFSIFVPTILHGVYDFCIMADAGIFVLAFLLFIIFLYNISIKKLKLVAENSIDLNPVNVFCPQCGHQMINNHCPNCNYQLNGPMPVNNQAPSPNNYPMNNYNQAPIPNNYPMNNYNQAPNPNNYPMNNYNQAPNPNNYPMNNYNQAPNPNNYSMNTYNQEPNPNNYPMNNYNQAPNPNNYPMNNYNQTPDANNYNQN